MWPMIAGAALSIGGSLLNRNSARKAAQAAENAARERAARIQNYNRGALGRSQELGLKMPSGFTPWNVKTGMGSWGYDPASKTVTAQLGPEVAQQQQRLYGAADNAWNQLGNFDRQQFAQQEFNRGQGLLQESRNADLSNLVGMLQRKGLAGFGQTATGGTSTVETNPMLNSLFDRRNRQDLELMDRSFGMADNQMDRLTQRATGMFDRGYQYNDDLNGQLEMGLRMGDADRTRALADWQNQARLLSEQERFYQGVELGGMEDVANAQQYGIQARLGSNAGFANMMQQGGNMLMSYGGGSMFPSLGAPSYSTQGWTPNQMYGMDNGTMWGGW